MNVRNRPLINGPADVRASRRRIGGSAGTILMVLLFFATLIPSVRAQVSGTGALSGRVTDPQGAAVPGAGVKIINQSTGEVRTVSSATDGTYNATLLPPGAYRVEVTKAGFKTAVYPAVQVVVTETSTLNISLEIGATAQTVTVSAQPLLVQTQSSALGQVVNEQTLETLPLVTRNYTQILGLSPGVQMNVNNATELGAGSGGTSEGPTGNKFVNGAREFDNNFEMNGVPVNETLGIAAGTPERGGIPIPNPDTIQQFKVQTGLYSAAYGRNAGADVNIVTKTGGNDFHGTAFEFFRNTDLNANDFFSNLAGAPRGALNQNQFGFTLGGPVKKDKLLFFVSYQGTRQKNGVAAGCSATLLAPAGLTDADRTAAGLGAAFAGQTGALGGVPIAANGSNINPVALELLNLKLPGGQFLLPSPQRIIQGPSGLEGISSFHNPCTYNENQYMTNLQYLQSGKSTFAVRFFRSVSDQTLSLSGSNVPGVPAPTNQMSYAFTLSHTYTFTSHLVNEATLGINEVVLTASPASPFNWSTLPVPVNVQPDGAGTPGLAIAGSYALNSPTPQKTFEPSINIVDAATYIRGAHTLEFGGEISRNYLNPGRFILGDSVRFASFPDFLLGLAGCPLGTFPASCNAGTPGGTNGTPVSNISFALGAANLFHRRYRQWGGALYLSDKYQVLRRLTLDIGLRYDRIGDLTDALGRLSTLDLSTLPANPPAAGTFLGYVVAGNFPGTPPPGVVRSKNDYAINGDNQNNFAPRVGFAWQILPNSTRLALRGGYGIYSSTPTALSIFGDSRSVPWTILFVNPGIPPLSSSTFQNPFPFPFFPSPLTPDSALPQFVPFSTRQQFLQNLFSDQHFRPGYVQEMSLNLQTALAANYLVEIGYVGSRGLHLARSLLINQAGLASPSNPIRGLTADTVANVNQRVPYGGLTATALNDTDSGGASWYNALQASLTKRFSSGLQFLASYTFSRALDTEAQNIVGNSNAINPAGNQLAPLARYGPSSFNRKHRLVVSFTYDFPTLGGFSRPVRGLLNGWEIGGVTTVQSGLPITLTANNPNNAFGITTDRVQIPTGCTNSQLESPGSVTSKLTKYFNTQCITHSGGQALFPLIPASAGGDGIVTNFGDSGVGIVYGPDQDDWDLSLVKRTKVNWPNEVANLEFRTEFFNAFNTPQFGLPDSNFGDPTFGQISTTSVNPRILQFALKFNF